MKTIESSPELKHQFDQAGFVVLRGFFSEADVERIHNEIDRYVRDVGPSLPPGDLMYEDKLRPETLKQIPHIAEHDNWFREFLNNDRTSALAKLLLGGPIVGKELEWFNKVPQDSRETPPHQDGYYFMIEPQEALTMWIALDEVDENNGCLRYVQGSHRKLMRPHMRSEILGFSQGIPDYGPEDISEEVTVAASPGDLLVHHSLTIHSAHANQSRHRQRRSLGMIYYSERAKQDTDSLQAYQKNLIENLQRKQKI